MRAFLVLLVLLLAAGVAGDRVAERLATDRAEQRLALEGLVDPQVTVEGFPFLTQLVSRRFDEVRLTAASLRLGGGQARRIRATGLDVDVPADTAVTVGRLRAVGLVPYAEVLRQAGLADVTMRAAGESAVRLRGEVTLLGRRVPVSVLGRVEARGRTLTVTPTSFRVAGDEVAAAVTVPLEDRFAVTYRLREPPEGVAVRRVTPRRDGFLVEIRGDGVRTWTTG